MGLFRAKPRQVRAAMLVSGHISEYLVGTEHYRDIFRRAREGQEILVELVPQADNPYDPNAIAGYIDGKIAGHLRRASAGKYRMPLVLANELGFRIVVRTEFQRRDDGDLRVGWLDIPSPKAFSQWLAMPEDERARGFDLKVTPSENTPRSVGHPL